MGYRIGWRLTQCVIPGVIPSEAARLASLVATNLDRVSLPADHGSSGPIEQAWTRPQPGLTRMWREARAATRTGPTPVQDDS